MEKTAIFRVDSSIDIGTGHVMRCLAFAEALKTKSINSHFICRDLPGNIHEAIKSRGFNVSLLPLLSPYKSVECSADYAGWLQVSQKQDAENFLNALHKLELLSTYIIIVDHYALDAIWEIAVKNKNKSLLIVIDDLVRIHSADIIIDQTLGRHESEYRKKCLAKKILVGSDYALIRTLFYVKREQSFEHQMNQKHNLLITLGGFDKKDTLSKIIRTIDKNPLDWIGDITILLNKNSPNFVSVTTKIKNHSLPINLLSFIDDMPTFMLNYSLAIGAPGTTTWERAALGIPAVLIPIAENQRDVADAYIKKSAGFVIFPEDISEKLLPSLYALKENYTKIKNINYTIADGLGLRRIIQEIWPEKSKNGLEISLHKATKKDITIVYEWQCQPGTRRYARNPLVPSFNSHKDWMKNKLADPMCYFYIIHHGNIPAGVIRLDRIDSFCYEVSIFIDEHQQHLGIAKLALKMVAALHAEIDIIATVLDGNIASQSLFKSLNYKKHGEEKFKLERRLNG